MVVNLTLSHYPHISTCWQIAVAAVKFFLTGDEKEDSEDESSSDSEVSDWPLVCPSDKCMYQIHSSAVLIYVIVGVLYVMWVTDC